jgi:prephenate dehydrogenase
MKITIVGAGRAGSSFASALRHVGHVVDVVHHDEVS